MDDDTAGPLSPLFLLVPTRSPAAERRLAADNETNELAAKDDDPAPAGQKPEEDTAKGSTEEEADDVENADERDEDGEEELDAEKEDTFVSDILRSRADYLGAQGGQ